MTDAPSREAPRSYRILARMPEEGTTPPTAWTDCDLHPGASPDAALKRAIKTHPTLKEQGVLLVAIPESAFRVLTREVKMIEAETFTPIAQGAKQEALADDPDNG